MINGKTKRNNKESVPRRLCIPGLKIFFDPDENVWLKSPFQVNISSFCPKFLSINAPQLEMYNK